jgi:hypothetical protein
MNFTFNYELGKKQARTQEEALRIGLHFFLSSELCPLQHAGYRRTSDSKCLDCITIENKKALQNRLNKKVKMNRNFIDEITDRRLVKRQTAAYWEEEEY